MPWTTIISFTDKNSPFRYCVATSTSPEQPGENPGDWYNVTVNELDVKDNIINRFGFMYYVPDDRFESLNSGDPILLISGQMAELVRQGKESW